jgi:hypothetical protein
MFEIYSDEYWLLLNSIKDNFNKNCKCPHITVTSKHRDPFSGYICTVIPNEESEEIVKKFRQIIKEYGFELVKRGRSKKRKELRKLHNKTFERYVPISLCEKYDLYIKLTVQNKEHYMSKIRKLKIDYIQNNIQVIPF